MVCVLLAAVACWQVDVVEGNYYFLVPYTLCDYGDGVYTTTFTVEPPKKDTLGAEVLSFVRRLSLSPRFRTFAS